VDGQPHNPDAVAEMVSHARAVSQLLTRLGWAVLVIGVLAVVGTLVELALGDISLERALGLMLGTSLAGILSGATAYGAGTNVGLSAERLAHAVNPVDPGSA
jgi:hypothetical protein